MKCVDDAAPSCLAWLKSWLCNPPMLGLSSLRTTTTHLVGHARRAHHYAHKRSGGVELGGGAGRHAVMVVVGGGVDGARCEGLGRRAQLDAGDLGGVSRVGGAGWTRAPWLSRDLSAWVERFGAEFKSRCSSGPSVSFRATSKMDDDDGALAMSGPLSDSAVHADDIARAIAASLEDSKRKDVIVIDSDSEPDDPDAQFQRDLDAALKASQADPARASGMPAPADTPAMSSFMLERKKLEAERLARQKRLRGEDSTTSSARDGGDDDDADKPPPQKRQATTASRARAGANRSYSSSASTSSNSGLFWDGELRPTANMHVDANKATGPVFRLTEIIGDVRNGCEIIRSLH